MAAPRAPLSAFPALGARPRLLVPEQPISGRHLRRATNRRSPQPRGTMGADEGRSTKWRRRVLPSAPFPLLNSDPPPRNTNQSARAAATHQPISGDPVPYGAASRPAVWGQKNGFCGLKAAFLGLKIPILGCRKASFFFCHRFWGTKPQFGVQKKKKNL